ncbi:MAG: hypothetical protein RL660_3068 [Bacteroidota bacterium]|jgi:DNA-binding LytR/AlgR family response regulator
MIRCIIVDDEQQPHGIIKNYAQRYGDIEILGHAYNAVEAQDLLEKHAVDLVFLDIQMPEITGLDFIKSLNQLPNIILITAYSDFALDGFDLGVVDYLLKPVPYERFEKAIAKLQKILSNKPEDDLPPLQFRVGGITKLFEVNSISYFQSLSNYVKIWTGSQSYLTIGTLTELENSLPKGKFVRIHKSYLVPIAALKSLKNLQFVTIDKTKLPIGRTYRNIVKQLLNDVIQ